ncbi:hypothetical protein ABZ543_17660 [Streptomyces roseifaciens]
MRLTRYGIEADSIIRCPDYAEDYLGQQVTKVLADRLTDADFIAHLDSDCVIRRVRDPPPHEPGGPDGRSGPPPHAVHPGSPLPPRGAPAGGDGTLPGAPGQLRLHAPPAASPAYDETLTRVFRSWAGITPAARRELRRLGQEDDTTRT